MSLSEARPTFWAIVYLCAAVFAGGTFTYAAVQGEFGLLRRMQISAEAEALRAERDRLAAELAQVTNLTRRLSDGYLDLDLLDQQARDVLGLVRADEIVIR
jgi:cell division protein FtsB